MDKKIKNTGSMIGVGSAIGAAVFAVTTLKPVAVTLSTLSLMAFNTASISSPSAMAPIS